MTDIIATDYNNNAQNKFNSIEPAIDPGERPTFLLDWELTLKCNLDCSYCGDDPLEGGHWSKAEHPSLEECLKTVDFMFEYVDLYMQYKPRWTKVVILNIYGGESLLHPDIDIILEAVNEKYKNNYANKWPLKITCTTNLIVGERKLNKAIEYIQEFTVSYHSESTDKQKKLFQDNMLKLKQADKDFKCIVLMHSDQSKWPALLDIIEFCKNNNIRYLPRQLDGDLNSNYNSEQVEWFKQLYSSKSKSNEKTTQQELLTKVENDQTLSQVGRACCGGRNVCLNENLKDPVFYVTDNNFYNWYCTVNWFFVYIKQSTKKIYVNKDCKMNFDGNVDAIGDLDHAQDLLDWTSERLAQGNMPLIQCAKSRCRCGLCAPKAVDKSTLCTIMDKHVTKNVFVN